MVQYVKYMIQVAQGNLGDSFYFESRPVTQMHTGAGAGLGLYRGAGRHNGP